jgi:hypothetical protein
MDVDSESIFPCAEKLAFETKRQADAAAVVAAYQHAAKLRTYLCQYCKLWHLASHFSDK